MNNLIGDVSSTQSQASTDPPTIFLTDVSSQSWRATLGGTIRYDITDRFDIGADILFRRIGYDMTADLHEQDEGEAEDLIEGRSEETRADVWDVPVLFRYYSRSKRDGPARLFFTGGLALRSVTNLSSVVEFTDEDLLRDTDNTPIGPAKDLAGGAVLGGGVQLRDEVGLKVELEFRVTRWFQQNIMTGPVESGRNQAEILFGFTF